jgi:predicted transcriptional regulator
MTVSQAHKLWQENGFSVSERTVRRYCEKRQIDGVKQTAINGRYIIPNSAVAPPYLPQKKKARTQADHILDILSALNEGRMIYARNFKLSKEKLLSYTQLLLDEGKVRLIEGRPKKDINSYILTSDGLKHLKEQKPSRPLNITVNNSASLIKTGDIGLKTDIS